MSASEKGLLFFALYVAWSARARTESGFDRNFDLVCSGVAFVASIGFFVFGVAA